MAMEGAPELAVPQPMRRGGSRRGGGGASTGWRRWFGVAVAGLAKLKLLLVFGSALLSIAAYSLLFGWWLAAGFVAVLAVHELGHVLAMRIKGFPASAPYFIPFLGALIFAKRNPRDAMEDAFIGAGGPVTGTLACWLVLGLYALTRQPVFAALAVLGFLIHLFNLVPVTPLDGGRILSFMRWWAWVPAFVGLLFVFTYQFGSGTFALPVSPIDYLILFGVLATLRAEWRRDRALRAQPVPGDGVSWEETGGGLRVEGDHFPSSAPAAGTVVVPASGIPLWSRIASFGTWLALAAASGVGLYIASRVAPPGMHLL